MSGICSAHHFHHPDCQTCKAMPINLEEEYRKLLDEYMQNAKKFFTFYNRIAFLTYHHQVINDHACVAANVLGAELEKVDPQWHNNVSERVEETVEIGKAPTKKSAE